MKPTCRSARFVQLVYALFVGSVLVLPQWLAEQPAAARPNIRDAFFDVYPAAVGSRLDALPSNAEHCGVCHFDFNGGGTRNPYGAEVEDALANFPGNPAGRRSAVESIETNDADGDGFSALVEVLETGLYANTPTFPGLTLANVGSTSNIPLAEIEAYLTPVVGGDTTPPDVVVLAPDGGETLTANAGVTLSWTATDANTIVAVAIDLSLDDGVTFVPLALGLPNTGTFQWFPANRPSSLARVRVRATDSALNEGSDESDAAFGIVSPAGGIAPTTLRDFDQPGTQPLEGGVPLNDPVTCAACHGGYDAAVEPYQNWNGSLMAQASRDPLFEACLAIANQDAPDSGDLCLRCHIPAGWLAGRSVPTSGIQMLAADRHGVSCDLCHRLVDPVYDPLSNPIEDAGILAALSNPATEFGNGMYTVDPSGARRGPFVDAALGHPIIVSPFHREAALCGTCHDVSNPAFENDGGGLFVLNALDAPPTNFSPAHLMPIERTYSEWLHSEYNSPQGVFAPEFGGNKDYVASCQDCHMRDVTGVGCNLAGAPVRSDLPLHDLTGGSAWLPAILDQLFPGEVDPAAGEAAAARARYMLQNAALLEASQDGDSLAVRVTNNSGHKLPTGYPEGRRVWLNVRFYDAQQALVGESGTYQAATGDLMTDPELRIYEAKPGLDEFTAPLVGAEPGPSFHFVLNNKIFKDTRIPPRGFTNAAFASFGGAPIGAAYADGQHWDDASYAIPAGAASAEVRLYYQSTSREYVEFLRDENTTNSAGQTLYDLWAANDRSPPEQMALVTVPVVPRRPGDTDGDGDIDLSDLGVLLAAYGACEGDPGYVADADFDASGCVDLSDLGVLLSAYGT